MISMIMLLVFGSGLVYLSLQNTTLVTLTFLQFSYTDIPLYYVITGSIILGIILAYITNLVNSISHAFDLRSKNKTIKQEQKEVLKLTKDVHHLQLENAGLKKDNDPNSIDHKSM